MASSTAIRYAASRAVHYENQTLTSGKSICRINSSGYCQIRIYNENSGFEFEIFNNKIVLIKGVTNNETLAYSFGMNDNNYLVSTLSGTYNIDIESQFSNIVIDSSGSATDSSYKDDYKDKTFGSNGKVYTSLTYETSAGLTTSNGITANEFKANSITSNVSNRIVLSDKWQFVVENDTCTVSVL